MSDDEFSTLNIKRQQMARELEELRQRYLEHHATITRLEQDSPSELLASRYRDVRQEIERSLAKVDEMGAPIVRTASTGPAPVLPPTPPPRIDPGQREILPPIAEDVFDPNETIARRSSLPPRPVRTADTDGAKEQGAGADDSGRRLILIALATLVVLTILGALAYRFSKRAQPGEEVVVESTSETSTVAAEPDDPVATAAADVAENPVSAISITPTQHDFGTIRKGTRAIRQFSIENSSNSPVAVKISRSACRCLWFDYESRIPAKSSTILAVTVDGGKAKAGVLDEKLVLTAGTNRAEFTVEAKIE